MTLDDLPDHDPEKFRAMAEPMARAMQNPMLPRDIRDGLARLEDWAASVEADRAAFRTALKRMSGDAE